jgi:hypothetical protein
LDIVSNGLDSLVEFLLFLPGMVQHSNQSLGVSSDFETSRDVICIVLATRRALDVNGMTKGTPEHLCVPKTPSDLLT